MLSSGIGEDDRSVVGPKVQLEILPREQVKL